VTDQKEAPFSLFSLGGLSANGDGLGWCVGGDGLIGDAPPLLSLLDLGGLEGGEGLLSWCVGGDGLVVDGDPRV
jgi:hypothetical protein